MFFSVFTPSAAARFFQPVLRRVPLVGGIERIAVEAQEPISIHPSSRRTEFSLRSNGNLTHVPSTGPAAGRIVGRVSRQRIRNGSPADQVRGRAALELSPQRAFVLHLDARAQPPRSMVGRIEHVTSGQIARITSLRALTTFLRDVLRDAAES